MVTEAAVRKALRTVKDPEMKLDLVVLGLVYDIRIDGARVEVTMSLTSPACPVAGSLPGEVEGAARQTPGVGKVSLELTWDPPFTIDRIPDEIRLMLGID